MSNLKKILALVLALALVMTMFASAAIKTDLSQFTDADQFTEAQKEALALIYPVGVISGVSDTMIGSANLTRAQLCVVLYVLYNGSTTGAAAWTAQVFDDVAATSWAAGYVNWAYTKGLIYGYGNGKFGPDDAVTPLQAAAMLARLFDAKSCSNAATFAQDAQAAAVKYGLISGIETVNFFGQKLIARGDMFIMIANALTANVNGKVLAKDVFGLKIIEGAILVGAEKQYYKDGKNSANAYSVFAFRTSTSGDVTYFASDLLCVEDDATVDEIGCKYTIVVSDKASYNGFYRLYAAYEMTGDSYYSVVSGTVNDAKLVLSGKTQNVFFDANAIVYVNGAVVTGDAMTTFAKYYGAANTAAYKLIDNDGDGYYEYAFINYYELAGVAGEWITGNVTYYSSSKTYSINGTAYKWGQYWDKTAGKFVDCSAKCYTLLGTQYVAISDVKYDFYVADGYIYNVRISESTKFSGNYGVAVKWNGLYNTYKNMQYFTFVNENNDFVSAYVEKINEATGTQYGYGLMEYSLVYFTNWNTDGDVCSLYTADYFMSNYTFNYWDESIANAGAVSSTVNVGWDFATKVDLSKTDAYYCLLSAAEITAANVASSFVAAAQPTCFVKYAGWTPATSYSATANYGLQIAYTALSVVPTLASTTEKAVTVSLGGTKTFYTINGDLLFYDDPNDSISGWTILERAQTNNGVFYAGYKYATGKYSSSASVANLEIGTGVYDFNDLKNVYGDMLVVATAYKEILVDSYNATTMGTQYFAVPFTSLRVNYNTASALATYEAFSIYTFITRSNTAKITISADYGTVDTDQIQIYCAHGYWGYRAYADVDENWKPVYSVTVGGTKYTITLKDDGKWYALDGDGNDPGDIAGDSLTDYDLAVAKLVAALNLGTNLYTDASISNIIEALANSLSTSYVTTGQQLLNVNYGVVFLYGRLSAYTNEYTWRAYYASEVNKDFGCGLYYDDSIQQYTVWGNRRDPYNFVGDELIYTQLNGVNYVKAMKVTVANSYFDIDDLDEYLRDFNHRNGQYIDIHGGYIDDDIIGRYKKHVIGNDNFPYGDDVLPSGWITREDAKMYVYGGMTKNYSTSGWEINLYDTTGKASTAWCSVGLGGVNAGDLILVYTDDKGVINNIVVLAHTVEGAIVFAEGNTYYENIIKSTGEGTLTAAGAVKGVDGQGNYYTDKYDTTKTVLYVYEAADGTDTYTTTFSDKWIGLTCEWAASTNYVVVWVYAK